MLAGVHRGAAPRAEAPASARIALTLFIKLERVGKKRDYMS